MELVGEGLQLAEPEAKKVEVAKVDEPKRKKLPDPIGESIQERKDYGSYLSVIKGAKGQPEEIIKFEVKGIPDKDLNTPVVKFEEPSTKLS